MAKKKKKDADFQKVKLKVGKRLTKGGNITKTEFKSKKIILKEAHFLGDNPITSLARNVSSNTQFKLICLSKLNDGYFDGGHEKITGETINTLAKLLLDEDDRVRSSAIRCIKKCINKLLIDGQSVTPFLTILLTYIKCAITHLDNGVNSNSKDLLDYVCTKCDKTLFNLLMQTLLPLLVVDSRSTAKDFELAASIVQVIHEPEKHVTIKNGHEEVKWNPKENHCDLSKFTIQAPNLDYNISFQLSGEEDVRSTFYDAVTKMVNREISCLEKRRSDNLVLSPVEARKLIASLKIANARKIEWDQIKKKLTNITISDEAINNRSSKKMQLEVNNLTNRLRSLLGETEDN